MQIIGHRGASALAPENTWESFDVALDIGVDAIETDVRATSDGELVLIHDERLDRTTNGHGYIQRTTWSSIKTLDAGSWFSDKYRDAKVPHLRETLEHYARLTHFVLEIKQPGIEPQILKMVHDLGLLNRVTFTSFDFNTVQKIKFEAPDAKVGFLTSNIDWKNVTRVVDANLEQFCPPANVVTRKLVVKWKDVGLEVRAWGVKNTTIMMKALEAGVDGMTVDFPHLLIKVLGREH